MARPERFAQSGYFHVITRATGGDALFRDDDDRRIFVHHLHRVSARRGWVVYAYCLMTTHYHVVLETKTSNLSSGMQQLNAGYVTAFNERWGRFGTLVSGRFRSLPIESEEYLGEACRYVFLNPVKAELCRDSASWPWSGGILAPAMSSL